MTDEPLPRRYFTVVDAIGSPAPAMEYWAATPNEEEAVYDVMPLRRFVKLIGSGESLVETGDGVFMGTSSQRTFYRFPANLD